MDISDTIDRKIESVKCYQSQFVGASGHVPEMVRTITAYFGSRIGTRHAEPFFSHETLGFSGLDQLVGGTGASLEAETPVMTGVGTGVGTGPRLTGAARCRVGDCGHPVQNRAKTRKVPNFPGFSPRGR